MIDPFRGITRRGLLRSCGVGLLNLSLPTFLTLRGQAATSAAGGKARACIVLYCWGGMSHLETWDPKPDAPPEIRGTYQSIATATPGVRLGEYMPRFARQTERLAIIRSVHHKAAAHGKGMYWNITGHPPPQFEQAVNQPPSRSDWPCLGAMVSKFRRPPAGLPGAVQIPYPLVDNNTLQAGDNAGFLGVTWDPVIVRPSRGKPYGGVSRDLGAPVLQLGPEMDRARLQTRDRLARAVEKPLPTTPVRGFDHYRQMALDMLLEPRVQAAFDLDREDPRVRDRYGEHICGQSMLLARRLVEAGVPLVQVVCAAGDLNGSAGDHWDTHGDNFSRLKNALLPPLETASSALLDDLADRGLLDQTLVVWLTEFGRTPKINGSAGRDHYPNCYSVAMAGGGIRGGQVHGRSDRHGTEPADQPCGPNDLHATIFQALGIPLDSQLIDNLGRPHALTDGRPLPILG